MLTFMDLGWWLGHLFELFGIALVGASAAYDLRRGRRSRPLAGDFARPRSSHPKRRFSAPACAR